MTTSSFSAFKTSLLTTKIAKKKKKRIPRKVGMY